MRLQLLKIGKQFPGVKALENVDFQLLPGEVHALCGENGAGKSTLMNILTGNLQPDSGEIRLNGQKISIRNPAQAAELGIAIVYQQLSLVDTLSVAENIFANQQPRNRWGFIQYRRLFAETNELLQRLKVVGIRPQTLVSTLSPGQKQMVEIAKALSKNPDILILDEPTASITERETETLFGLIRQLKNGGKSVIYISHRMAEIFVIADRVTVLKDGRYQATRPVAEVSTNDLIKLMVGRDLELHSTASASTEDVLLSVKDLSGPAFQNISFSLKKGEILGLAGLVGAGRTEIAQTIFGYLPKLSGEVFLNAKRLTIHHPADAVAAGIGYLPEERKTLGVFQEMSVEDNVVAARLSAARKGRFFNAGKRAELAQTFRTRLRIATPNTRQRVVNLSGGNQQKVVLAKWLLADPAVLMVDEPTHGIDVGAKAEIHELLRGLARDGKGILLISSELPELLGLADRILVIREGQLTGEISGKEATEEAVMRLATDNQ
ncbi:MAG: sugar ABC transporter ATP-binding protein [Cytophagaceae bacterium]|nr:sugar ABC transporter ATP-binding protein [Cytophagaceae bacterium]